MLLQVLFQATRGKERRKGLAALLTRLLAAAAGDRATGAQGANPCGAGAAKASI